MFCDAKHSKFVHYLCSCPKDSRMEIIMIFNPKTIIKTNGSFIFPKKINAIAHSCLNKDIIKEFWNSFSFNSSILSISECNEFIFSIGNTPKLPLDDNEYSINIEEDGICVYAKNEKDLLRGFMTLLDRIKAVDLGEQTAAEAECCQIKDRALIQSRLVHFCIFPETEIWELQRFVRFCGALKYTHIVLEFWGTLKYDCLKELSWPNGFTKEQIRPIITEAKDLGLEVIPMFNHWGHASAARVMHGKHVVLDQNLALQTYFSEDGWCWDISKPKVKKLLHQIREELIELCGEGSYFHIGCDEAYNFDMTKENMDFICDFINEISEELKVLNRKVIAWGDMFLFRHKYYNPKNKYACNAPSPEVEEYLLDHLSRDIIIADWQYDSPEAPVETVSVFQNKGFDCLLCPWDKGVHHIKAAISTVTDQKLNGIMHTTWHTLSKGFPYVTLVAVGGFESLEEYTFREIRAFSASLLRKVMPVNGNYEMAGWSKFQVSDLW